MKNSFIISIALVSILFAKNVFADSIFGAGATSCGKYLRNKESSSYSHWITGYITGSQNYYDHKIKDTDIDAMLKWLDDYCSKNPLEYFSVASEALFQELIANKPVFSFDGVLVSSFKDWQVYSFEGEKGIADDNYAAVSYSVGKNDNAIMVTVNPFDIVGRGCTPQIRIYKDGMGLVFDEKIQNSYYGAKVDDGSLYGFMWTAGSDGRVMTHKLVDVDAPKQKISIFDRMKNGKNFHIGIVKVDSKSDTYSLMGFSSAYNAVSKLCKSSLEKNSYK